MLRQLLSKVQRCKDFSKSSKPCHVGIHWIALAEYSQMSTHVPINFSGFLNHFWLAKLATSSIKVNGLILTFPRLKIIHLMSEMWSIYLSLWNLYFIHHFTIRVPLESAVCYSHTFKNNLGMMQKFAKYLKESCCLASDQHFSFKYFPKNAFVRKVQSKLIVRHVSS